MTSKNTIFIYSQTKYYLIGSVLGFVGFSGGLTHFFFSRFEDPVQHIVVLSALLAFEVTCLYRAIKPRVLLKLMPEQLWTHKAGAFHWSEIEGLSFEEGEGYKGRKAYNLVISLKEKNSNGQEQEKIRYDLKDLNVRNEEVAILIEQYIGN